MPAAVNVAPLQNAGSRILTHLSLPSSNLVVKNLMITVYSPKTKNT
jgi:hypothetical protein